MQKFLSVSTYIIVALFIKIKSVLYKLPIYISDYHKFKSLKPGDIICGQWMVVSNIFNSNIRLCIRINKKYNYQYPMLFMSFKTYVNLYTTNNHPRIRRNHMNSAYIATLLSAQAQSWNFIEFHTEFLRINHAAHTIQRAFRIAISNPNYLICNKRLLREFNELL